MKIILMGDSVVGSHSDFESRQSLLASYGAGTRVRRVPDGTPMVPASGIPGIADPRFAMLGEDVLTSVRQDVDDRTDEIIAAGYVYPPPPSPSGIQFKMDIEHQMSYKGAYDFRAYISYPYTIKGVGENYMTFQAEEEFTQFILYGFAWMDATLRYGWTLKASLGGKPVEELMAWVDPRG